MHMFVSMYELCARHGEQSRSKRAHRMSHPSLPPLPEPAWPLQELDRIARAAAALLDASRVWFALSDRHGVITPCVAVAVENDTVATVDPRARPELVKTIIGQLTRPGAPATPPLINDIHQRPEFLRSAGADAHAIRAIAATPLIDDGRVIGAFIIARARPGPLSERALWLLNMFASQALTAVRLTASAENNKAQALILRAVLGASQALTSTLDSHEVFRAIIESIQDVISCESALIFRYDERAGALRVVKSMGVGTEPLEGSRVPVDDPDSKAALVARTRRLFNGQIGPNDEIGAHTNRLVKHSDVSLLSMPLISKGHLRGVASLAREQPFTQREVSALQRLSPFAAAALENVQLYQRAQAAREQQEAIFASASDGFAVVNESLRLVQVNKTFARYVAADPTKLVGELCCLVFGAEQDPPSTANCLLCQKRNACLLREVFETGQAHEHVECVFPAPPPPEGDNTSFGPLLPDQVIDFSLTLMQGPGGRPRLLLVGRDVSGPREVERLRSAYIHMTSHEMSAPLHSISGFLNFFLDRYGQTLDSEYIGMLQTALTAANSMNALVEDLEVLSRRDAKQWINKPEPADLSAQARAALAELEPAALEKGVILRMAPPQRLPLAMIDPHRARQVARNLISNAIKYTPPGGHVMVSVSPGPDQVVLQVKDTGIGISEDEQKRIWERYYRVGQSEGAKYVSGQGLGLAIVRIIVHELGGTYRVESMLGEGSAFIIGFPRADRSQQR